MLVGTRIIEIEGLGPAPFAAMTLADMGADVIVVHRPGGTPSPGLPERSILDRGKRSITLDLKDAADIETLGKLVESAHGLIEGFRPGVMERLGLGPDWAQALNPSLVYGRMTGWGQQSPLAQTAGHDLNYVSLSGAAWFASNQGETPFPPPTLVGDIGGGAMYLVAGMLAGILKATSTGIGTIVDAAMYDGSAHLMNLLMTLRQGGGMTGARGQNLLDGPHWSRCYACADGKYISVQSLEPRFYAVFLDILNLSSDPDFKQQFNKSLWPTLTNRLAIIFATRTRHAWAELFEGSDACVAPVLSPDEALNHPMNAARQTWSVVDGALQAAPAPRFDGHCHIPGPIPNRGQHDQEIRAEIEELSSARPTAAKKHS